MALTPPGAIGQAPIASYDITSMVFSPGTDTIGVTYVGLDASQNVLFTKQTTLPGGNAWWAGGAKATMLSKLATALGVSGGTVT